MNEFKLTLIEEPCGHALNLQTWVLRIGVAVVFVFIGIGKFAAQSEWTAIFDRIGFGQWFRYFTGTLQIGGALLVLIPRTFAIGILVLACTMLGATAAWIFFLGAPFNALIPGVILGGLLVVGGEDVISVFSRRTRT